MGDIIFPWDLATETPLCRFYELPSCSNASMSRGVLQVPLCAPAWALVAAPPVRPC